MRSELSDGVFSDHICSFSFFPTFSFQFTDLYFIFLGLVSGCIDMNTMGKDTVTLSVVTCDIP